MQLPVSPFGLLNNAEKDILVHFDQAIVSEKTDLPSIPMKKRSLLNPRLVPIFLDSNWL